MKLEELNPKTVDASFIKALVQKIHGLQSDFDDGDLEDRIFWFDTYTLKDLPLSKVDVNEWQLDDDHVKELKLKIEAGENIEPIVFDPIEGSIIDGAHRAKAFSELGKTTIKAYVGTKKNKSYGERENHDD